MKKIIIAGTLGITALTGLGLPGVETITANAAVQEINDTVEGTVIEVNSDYFIVQSTKLNEDVTIYFDFKTDVKVGDVVKVNGKGPLFSTAFSTWITADSIEKSDLKQSTITSDSLIQSNLLQNPLDQLKKKSGKVIEKNGNRIIIDQDGLEIIAISTPKVA
ncbi:hypothetical protein COD02_29625 [Bacillus thuringiensis]|uniref:hypothetical protein n=1 Tax=Bacillus thuringiensis TaxID=1428 RepID=UPI000BFC0892|nr:hypothetical protein [Bacillus thuringiensis]PGS78807.1 hypothetical protein COD02_29625 [Bacillus thuringiensis]